MANSMSKDIIRLDSMVEFLSMQKGLPLEDTPALQPLLDAHPELRQAIHFSRQIYGYLGIYKLLYTTIWCMFLSAL